MSGYFKSVTVTVENPFTCLMRKFPCINYANGERASEGLRWMEGSRDVKLRKLNVERGLASKWVIREWVVKTGAGLFLQKGPLRDYGSPLRFAPVFSVNVSILSWTSFFLNYRVTTQTRLVNALSTPILCHRHWHGSWYKQRRAGVNVLRNDIITTQYY